LHQQQQHQQGEVAHAACCWTALEAVTLLLMLPYVLLLPLL
jgi:hypothetical protein